MLADWAYVAPYWANLLHADPLSYYDLTNEINAERMQSEQH